MKRDARPSTILTSNCSIEDWIKLLGDTTEDQSDVRKPLIERSRAPGDAAGLEAIDAGVTRGGAIYALLPKNRRALDLSGFV